MKRIAVCLLVCLLLITGVACSEKPDTSAMSGFLIQPGLVMISRPTEDTALMEYAQDTTVQGFFNSITANDGFRVALLDENGKEVTDENMLVTDQMTFAVYEGESTSPIGEIPLQVTDPVKVRRHYANAAQ